MAEKGTYGSCARSLVIVAIISYGSQVSNTVHLFGAGGKIKACGTPVGHQGQLQ